MKLSVNANTGRKVGVMSAIDQAHQLIKEYNKYGKLCTQISPFDPEVIMNTAFYSNGSSRFRFTIKDGRLHGPGKIYFENTQLMEEIPFHKGVLHGVSRSWYEDGQIKWESNYINNQLNGIRRNWYSTSLLLSEYHYINNQPDGNFILWHQNGQIKESGCYLKGVRHGLFKEFDDEGKLLNKELFVKGISYKGKMKRLIESKRFNCNRLAKIKLQAVRRILLEEFGYERIAKELESVSLDKESEQELIRIDWHKEEEPLYLVKVKCPSTDVFYTLRVPPNMKSVREAVAWTFGVQKKEYYPLEEA